MANFDKIVRFIISKTEGGLQYTANDAGNWRGQNIGTGLNLGTNHGISGATMAMLYPKLTDAEVKAKIAKMTLSDAIAFYKINFWNSSKIEGLQNDAVAYQFFDHLINVGNIKWLKRQLLKKYSWFNTSFPYSLSNTEIATLNKLDSDVLYNDIMAARVQQYGSDKQNAKRPGKWPYEKKKIKLKPKSGVRNSSSLWDWLTGASNDKKFRI